MVLGSTIVPQCPPDQGVCIDATCTSLAHSSGAHSAGVPASDDPPGTSSEYRTMNCTTRSSFQREAQNISRLILCEFLIVSDLNCFLHFLSFEIRVCWNPKLHIVLLLSLSTSLGCTVHTLSVRVSTLSHHFLPIAPLGCCRLCTAPGSKTLQILDLMQPEADQFSGCNMRCRYRA